MAKDLTGYTVICFSPNDWFGLQTSKQHLMRQFAKSNKIIYVEPVKEIFSVLGRRSRWYKFRRSRLVAPNIRVVSPVSVIIHKRHKWIRQFNQHLKLFFLRRHLNPEQERYILWAYNPSAHVYFSNLPAELKVYFIADEYAAASGTVSPFIQSEEEKTLRQADIVFAITPELADQKQRMNENIHVARNAVDTSLFRPEQTYPVPEPLRHVSSPVIGYIGSFRHWVDVELIVKAANQIPEFRFVLAGPGLGQHNFPENVTTVGKIPYEDVPKYISGFDVGIIPFKNIEYARHADPLKLYEYLILGKPVVSIGVDSVTPVPGVVYTAATEDEFISHLKVAWEDRSESRDIAVEIGQQNSWEERTDFITKKLTGQLYATD
ncbi:MAG: putative teichuronic acid biosynthesis glycosyltransferase TuaH [Candidatus Marinimicrobia bacterium]|nr:putative teichuronic acid biosynthesis glycosyltransferase TuaH [Candidatus Neomarinimicrobiota bacterium]